MSNETIEDVKIYEIKEELRRKSKDAAVDMSSNYKQKLVYNLLDALKARDKARFLDVLLRAINRKDEHYKALAQAIEGCVSLPQETFEEWGYAIVIGIMASEENTQG
ncbi:MAG: hypothetical protein QW134_04335 [Nitrososphaeria archaeon]